ncbi:unnamed protein product [Ceutorhynchus assimilis]|uniref:Uncharacterized protein n=1 Tax=Ceutorhynchus assimilis TaxID=467358 RepID=A0A9N9MJ72_9CUCU|nr:unnamed protein product [Ceutorhynchus assimilis]
MDNVNNGLLVLYVLLLIGWNVQCDNEPKKELLALEQNNPRKSNKNNANNSPLTSLIPMLAMPFLVQTTFLPMILLGIKFMLIQSIFLGKFAIVFWVINLIRNHIKDQQGHLYSHNIHLNKH